MERLLKWCQLVTTTQITPRGIIYCGAHVGEYIPAMLEAGFTPVLAIEPNPEAFPELDKYACGHVVCVRSAAAERDGTSVYFQIKGVPTLNSTREPSKAYWEQTVGSSLRAQDLVASMEVPCNTLDTLVARHPADYNVLYVNVQGSELNVLRGAGALLPKLDVVMAEVNFAQRYEDSATFAELDGYLQDNGYLCVLLTRDPHQGFQHGEACYINTKAEYLAGLERARHEEMQQFIAGVMAGEI